MPTPSEQKALAFVAIVMLLGGAVRVLRAGSPTGPTELEQQAIARQATAADSATRAAKPGKRTRFAKPGKRDTIPVVIGGVASVPPSYARPSQPAARSPFGFPPPDPRIDTDIRGNRPQQAAPPLAARAKGQLPGGGTIDMDVASESDIERLPGIGPTFARRIVANRDSLGPFGSLPVLHRVKGIGPAMLQKLGPLVTFSGSAAARR